jgi:hypothetical protein
VNNGDGTFEDAFGYGVEREPCSVFGADLDADGDFDLAVANSYPGKVSILRNLTGPYPYTCGDADGNDLVNVSDAVYLISYIFSGGPPPIPLQAGDVTCDTLVNVSDAVFLISFIFTGGPEPCDPDGNGEPDC